MSSDNYRLPYSTLDYSVSPEEIKRLCGDSLTVPWSDAIIGQARALKAMELGTAIKAKGYNIFVEGAPGTGRRSAVQHALSGYKPEKLELKDIAYVYNFSLPQSPIALYFRAGQAVQFKKDIHDFIENIKKLILLHAESGEARHQKESLETEWENEENKRLADYETLLALEGFRVVQTMGEDGQTRSDIIPLQNGEPSSFEQLQLKLEAGEISRDSFATLRQKYFFYLAEMRNLFMDLSKGRSELESRLASIKVESLKPLVNGEIRILLSRYEEEKNRQWILELEKDIIHNLYLFGPEEKDRRKKSPLARYGVNVLLDRSNVAKAPIIYESSPNYGNLFGAIERTMAAPQDQHSAYLKIRGGSLLRSSGGFLVMQAEELLRDEEAWTAVKRVLRSGRLEIQNQQSPFAPALSVKPEAIEVELKLVLIGGELVYDLLYNSDPDFQKLFRVCAEFDSTMPRNDESLKDYIAFAQKICFEEGLAEPKHDGLAAIADYGIRLAGSRNRLSTRFSKIADLLREADYQAAISKRDIIDSETVQRAKELRSWLADMPEEKLADMIVSGEILLQASGSAVGRVNGLAVHDRGYYAFGLPAVISAQLSPGESGLINIEGESGLSGEIYDKAVLIVEGFLRSRYSRDYPLSISASICFEQSYTAIEGDSASSTAVYALLSAIARVPLRQDIAVTGSVNQMGQIQPVGGVTEKVEGFYRICKKAGLTGTQGVMIPKQNINNLTLSREIMEAVKDGSFSIYAVGTVDEGLEVLTGHNPGQPDENDRFPEGSFNYLVSLELLKMAKTIKAFKD
ncbi:ATP-binding protein [Spirochaetota bacterium]